MFYGIKVYNIVNLNIVFICQNVGGIKGMKEENKVKFEIRRIFAGWFDVRFCCKDKEIDISASDAWGHDAPGQMLQELAECNGKNEFHKYVIWDEEPGSYVICIEKEVNACTLTVIYTEIDSDEWKKIDLHGDLSYQEINDYVIHRSSLEVLIQKEIDFEYFVDTVISAFLEYYNDEKKSEYENNWLEYPRQELEELRKLYGR